MGFTGSDIMVFAEQPSGELYARWMQWAFFILLQVSLIWRSRQSRTLVFDEEVVNITRKFINLRYQLLPYLYTMFWQYIEQGLPMLKPLVYFDQDDIQTH
jgi:alpha-glucosidase